VSSLSSARPGLPGAGEQLRRCRGTRSSPASPWPPSSLPCRRRSAPPSQRPPCARTTAGCSLRSPSLPGANAGLSAASSAACADAGSCPHPPAPAAFPRCVPRHLSPSSRASTASASRRRRTARCFSSSRCFSTLASSQRPLSISRWSGRSRLSVGATRSSGSFRVRARSEKKYMFSAFSLRPESPDRDGGAGVCLEQSSPALRTPASRPSPTDAAPPAPTRRAGAVWGALPPTPASHPLSGDTDDASMGISEGSRPLLHLLHTGKSEAKATNSECCLAQPRRTTASPEGRWIPDRRAGGTKRRTLSTATAPAERLQRRDQPRVLPKAGEGLVPHSGPAVGRSGKRGLVRARWDSMARDSPTRKAAPKTQPAPLAAQSLSARAPQSHCPLAGTCSAFLLCAHPPGKAMRPPKSWCPSWSLRPGHRSPLHPHPGGLRVTPSPPSGRRTPGTAPRRGGDSREGVLLPQDLWRQRLVDGLLLALRAGAAVAAVHYLGALHLLVPRAGHDVVGFTVGVTHHACHLAGGDGAGCIRQCPEDRDSSSGTRGAEPSPALGQCRSSDTSGAQAQAVPGGPRYPPQRSRAEGPAQLPGPVRGLIPAAVPGVGGRAGSHPAQGGHELAGHAPFGGRLWRSSCRG